jgi:predicted metallo-beta-lactamase superfamily hydrolase
VRVEFLGAESLGVRSLCCLISLPDRRIVIDPGVALGSVRSGLPPHPVQIAVGARARARIVGALNGATDVVFSHFHGDHVPLLEANPYQLSFRALPPGCRVARFWSKSPDDLSPPMRARYQDLKGLLGTRMRVAEERSSGPLSFSRAVSHGPPDSRMGTVMMTRVEMEDGVFVHGSDIQLLDDAAVDRVIGWRPDLVLAAGPPLHLGWLGRSGRERAWRNGERLARKVGVVILDHHLLRSEDGGVWLDALGAGGGKTVCSAAERMGRPRLLLEAWRERLYEEMPVSRGWHDDYARGRVDPDSYLEEFKRLRDCGP